MTVVLAFALLAVAPGTSPAQLSYVTSDSMEPTIATGDGFLVVDAGPAEPGDIVTFWSPERGSYVTHRVVETTDSGLITRGDNNPTSDQSAGYPHVDRERVVGTVLTVGGDPLVIPWLGAVVDLVESNAVAVLAVLVALGGRAVLAGGSPRPERDLTHAGRYVTLLFVLGWVAVVAALVLGGSGQGFQYVAVEHDSPAPDTVTVGQPHEETVILYRDRLPLTRSLVSAEGMTVTERSANATAIEMDVRVPPQSATGPHSASIRVRRYPAVLPGWLLGSLYRAHPVAAAAACATVLLGPLYLVSALLVDGRTPVRSRSAAGRRRREGGKDG